MNLTPKDLPALRQLLLSEWKFPSGVFFQAMTIKIMTSPQPEGVPPNPLKYSVWETETASHAGLWWVAEPMCVLLEAAANSVPDDVRPYDLVQEDDETLDQGIAVFERPLLGTTADTGVPISIDAMVWGPVRLPPLPSARPGRLGLATSFYSTLDVPPEGTDPRHLLHDEMWFPVGRSDWPLNEHLNDEPFADITPGAMESFKEDRRLVAALYTLLHQAGLSTVTVEPGTRAARRRSVRAGEPIGHASVRVINLRQLTPSFHPDGDVESTRREYDHQWIVSGHMRNQPYGPGRSKRRLQWIAPYTKGPEGTELRVPETVKVWKR